VSEGQGGARQDWEERIGRRSDEPGSAADSRPALPPPGDVRAEEGAGQVTISWQPVEGALGYLVHRSEDRDGPFQPVDHGGRDVLAVPSSGYADTTGQIGRRYWYAVASVMDLDQAPSGLSEPVEAGSRPAGDAEVRLTARVDRRTDRLRRVWHMLGSERLSQLLIDETVGGRPIASEFDQALQLARRDLGVDRVRAHAILHDDLGVYREVDGRPVHDFSAIDRVYDRLLELRLRPVVELSYMPRDLARDPDATVFEYGAIISPPRDWDRWADLIRDLTQHLVDRYGLDEVATWGFEVWNEANLEVFWTGTRAEYLELYRRSALAVKAVHEQLLVGGPASAAAGWIGPFLDDVEERDVPVDFVSTHTYGNVPLDVRQVLDHRGLHDVEVWWTEWGVTPTHFFEVTDGAFGAPFVLHGMKAAQKSADWLAYWVVSDHFEELGRPPSLLHGGFGLLAVGNLRKPRWWALALAEQLGDDLVETVVDGDGAGSMVDAWVSCAPDGRIDVLAWNGTLDQSKRDGAAILDRRFSLRLEGLEAEAYQLRVARVDRHRSNLAARWSGERDWPQATEWDALAAEDELHEEDGGTIHPTRASAQLEFELPMPGILRVRLTPAGAESEGAGPDAAGRERAAPGDDLLGRR
jgi:xylan 1,4-beta-xylosidase